jgi:two-component system response regulator VanR
MGMNCCYANTTVLYADDETVARSHYAEFLADLFRDVYEACDGEEAWRYYQTYKPDIVLLDIEMPKMNGLEVAKKIRRHDSKTRIIIATAYVDEQRLLLAVELGLTRYLPKPFGRRELKEALHKAVLELDLKDRVDLGNGYTWSRSVQQLFNERRPLKLTKQENALLNLLGSNPGYIFSGNSIELHIWPDLPEEVDSSPRLKALIKRLRKKFPGLDIQNIYGEGYRLNRRK